MGQKFSDDKPGAWGSRAYWGNYDAYINKPRKTENRQKIPADSRDDNEHDDSSSGETGKSDLGCKAELGSSDYSDYVFSRLEDVYLSRQSSDYSCNDIDDSLVHGDEVDGSVFSPKRRKRSFVCKYRYIRDRLFFVNPLLKYDSDYEDDQCSDNSLQYDEYYDLDELTVPQPIDISSNSIDYNAYFAYKRKKRSRDGSTFSRNNGVGSDSVYQRPSIRGVRKAVKKRREQEIKMQKMRETLLASEEFLISRNIRKVSKILRKLNRRVGVRHNVRDFRLHRAEGAFYYVPGRIVKYYKKHSKLLRTSIKMVRSNGKFLRNKVLTNNNNNGGSNAGGNAISKSNQPLRPTIR